MSRNSSKKPEIEYGRKTLKAGALIAPLPAAMVSCGTLEKPNVLTIAWTGIVNTRPPMTYISVRPERYSYGIIKESGEFVINLTTSKMVRETDFCGVKSGKDIDKLKKCGLHTEQSCKVSAPTVSESPLSLECRVKEIKQLGSHDMFIAEIIAVNIEDDLIDEKGRLMIEQAGLLTYAHGTYFALGKKIGTFGFSTKQKRGKEVARKNPKKKKIAKDEK